MKYFAPIVVGLFFGFCAFLYASVFLRIGWGQRVIDLLLIFAVGRMLWQEMRKENKQ